VNFVGQQLSELPGFALLSEATARFEQFADQKEIDEQQAQSERGKNAPQECLKGLALKEFSPAEDALERIEMRCYHESVPFVRVDLPSLNAVVFVVAPHRFVKVDGSPTRGPPVMPDRDPRRG
jgi:hypothetical protein